MGLKSSISSHLNKLSDVKTKYDFYVVYEGQKRKGARGALFLDKRLRNIPAYMALGAKRGVLKTGLEAFEQSMRMVPVDTGTLARSGRLMVNNVVYAKGECENLGIDPITQKPIGGNTSVSTVKEKFDSLVPAAEDLNILKDGSAAGRIHFNRIGDEPPGLNVALWAHEALLPFGTGPKMARLPGRSGKYMEKPLQEVARRFKSTIIQEINLILSRAIK